jgi:hypothetical protein
MTDVQDYDRVIWVEDTTCKVELEWANGIPFAHIYVKEWDKAASKHIKELHTKLLSDLSDQGVDLLFFYTDKQKTIKFAASLKDFSYGHMDGKHKLFTGAWETREEE